MFWFSVLGQSNMLCFHMSLTFGEVGLCHYTKSSFVLGIVVSDPCECAMSSNVDIGPHDDKHDAFWLCHVVIHKIIDRLYSSLGLCRSLIYKDSRQIDKSQAPFLDLPH